MAQKHRRASEALRKAEERSCGGIPLRDREVSPFLHVGDIARVERLLDGAASAKYEIEYSRVSGLDADAMQQLIDCHLARNAVLGYEHADMESCPLAPPGVEATAVPRGDGVLVRVDVVGEANVVKVRGAIDLLETRLEVDASE